MEASRRWPVDKEDSKADGLKNLVCTSNDRISRGLYEVVSAAGPITSRGEMDYISKDLIAIRAVQPTDKAFIYSTWLKGLYYGNEWFREIDQDLYYKCYKAVIASLLLKPTVSIIVACLKDDPDSILAYSVVEKRDSGVNVVHWIFTKAPWRKLGIAKKLIPNNVSVVTHLTRLGKNIKPRHWIFDPFLI